MTTIYISLGSNIERDRHIRAGLDALHAEFGELRVSRVFESEAVGFNGRPFYNLVAAAETDLPLAIVCQRLRAMEFAHGREPDAKKFAPRTLDLDLLLYGDLVCETPLVLPRGDRLVDQQPQHAPQGDGDQHYSHHQLDQGKARTTQSVNRAHRHIPGH